MARDGGPGAVHRGRYVAVRQVRLGDEVVGEGPAPVLALFPAGRPHLVGDLAAPLVLAPQDVREGEREPDLELGGPERVVLYGELGRRGEDLDRLRLAAGEGELAAPEVDGGDLRDRGALCAGRVGAPHRPVGRRLLVALEDRDRPARPQGEGAAVPGRRSGGEVPVAAGQRGEHLGGERLVRRRWRGCGQGLVQAVGRLPEVAAVPPEEADMARHLDRRRPVRLGQRVLDRRAEVGVFAQHPLAPGDLPPGVPLGAPLVGEAGVVLAVPHGVRHGPRRARAASRCRTRGRCRASGSGRRSPGRAARWTVRRAGRAARRSVPGPTGRPRTPVGPSPRRTRR